MPELKLSISFPNVTSDGFPVLYPSGWSSSEVSHVCLRVTLLYCTLTREDHSWLAMSIIHRFFTLLYQVVFPSDISSDKRHVFNSQNVNCIPSNLQDPFGIHTGKKMMISKSEDIKRGTILVNSNQQDPYLMLSK